MTDWDEGELGGPEDGAFFSPGWYEHRRATDGVEFGLVLIRAWRGNLERMAAAFSVVERSGGEALLEGFNALASGESDPREALVFSL